MGPNDTCRTLLKAHLKSHTRVVNGRVVYIHDYDESKPQGAMAQLHERTVIGRHRSGTHYLRATDAEDGAKIQAAADRLGIKTDKRRAGANHHGRVGAYDHFHLESAEHALAIHNELRKQEPETEIQPKAPEIISEPAIPTAGNPFTTKGLATDALQAITRLAQAKSLSRNAVKPLCDLPEAEPARQAIKAAVDGGCSTDHIREITKAAFGGDLAGQSANTVAQAALFPAMEPEMAQASVLPDHAEELERSITKAVTICGSERPIEKAQVGTYTRTHMGKVIQVHEYTTRRQKSMTSTKQAHAASDGAMKANTAEAHQKAVASHMEALRHHTEAHELSPPDVADDHKELMEHHRAAARWHAEKAKGSTGTYGTEKVEPRGQERQAVKALQEAGSDTASETTGQTNSEEGQPQDQPTSDSQDPGNPTPG